MPQRMLTHPPYVGIEINLAKQKACILPDQPRCCRHEAPMRVAGLQVLPLKPVQGL